MAGWIRSLGCSGTAKVARYDRTGSPTASRRWLTRVGLPPSRLHDRRHLAASVAGAAGVELKTIQHQMGHSSPVTTAERTRSCSRRRPRPPYARRRRCCCPTHGSACLWRKRHRPESIRGEVVCRTPSSPPTLCPSRLGNDPCRPAWVVGIGVDAAGCRSGWRTGPGRPRYRHDKGGRAGRGDAATGGSSGRPGTRDPADVASEYLTTLDDEPPHVRRRRHRLPDVDGTRCGDTRASSPPPTLADTCGFQVSSRCAPYLTAPVCAVPNLCHAEWFATTSPRTEPSSLVCPNPDTAHYRHATTFAAANPLRVARPAVSLARRRRVG